MKRTHNVCLTTGEYEKDGQQKKRRITIGTMMTDDQNGNMSILLEVPPAFKTDSKTGYPVAWLSLFPIDNQNNEQQKSQPVQQYQQQPQTQYQQPQMPQQIQQPQQPQYQPQPANMAPPQINPNGQEIPF